MNLTKMLFNNLDKEDFFGLKILKNGYSVDEVPCSHNHGPNQPKCQYLEDVIVLEAKKMNTQVKQTYLDDFTNDLQAHNQSKSSKFSTRDAQLRTKEMQKQTVAAFSHTINMMANVEEYKVQDINGVKIVGPMKWIILILGPNHQAKDIRSLLETEYKNLNIIVILVTNPVRNIT